MWGLALIALPYLTLITYINYTKAELKYLSNFLRQGTYLKEST